MSGEDMSIIGSEKIAISRVDVPNVVMVGLPASGKSRIGRALSVVLGFGFLDLDEWVESVGGETIAQIFDQHGEQGFRAVEGDAIKEISNIRNHVISIGAGAIASLERLEQLQSLGCLVWLNFPPAECANRIYMSPDELRKRPLFADLVSVEDHQERRGELLQRLEGLSEERVGFYDKAEIVVSDHYMTPEDCAEKIRIELAAYRPRSKAADG